MKYFALIALVCFAVTSATQVVEGAPEIPPRYDTSDGDQLMKLLISKGFAKEKEDNIDQQCGCDCTCCQARNSQYWIDQKGAMTAAKAYVSKNLHLEGPKLDDYLNIHFYDKWEQFDVLKTGQLEIEQMSSFLKQVMGDMTIPI